MSASPFVFCIGCNVAPLSSITADSGSPMLFLTGKRGAQPLFKIEWTNRGKGALSFGTLSHSHGARGGKSERSSRIGRIFPRRYARSHSRTTCPEPRRSGFAPEQLHRKHCH